MMQEKILNRICPICGNNQGAVLHQQHFLLEENHPLPSDYAVVCCNQCQFIFADVACDQQQYDKFYTHFSKYEDSNIASGGALSAWDKERLEATANTIATLALNKDVRILDIGAANGGLLALLAAKGYQQLSALELSQACVDFIHAKNPLINVYQGTVFDDLPTVFADEKFDIVIMSHVMEHIYDVRLAIKSLATILKPESYLYIEVPDTAKYQEFYKTPFHYFDVEHINHFTLDSLATLFQVFGFKSMASAQKTIAVAEEEYYPALYHVFQKTVCDVVAVKAYIDFSHEKAATDIFNRLKSDQTPIAIWGMGSYAKRLLATTELKNCAIQHLIDVDVTKQGMALLGHIVSPPETLKGFQGLIVITSALFSKSIVKEIKHRGFFNEILVID